MASDGGTIESWRKTRLGWIGTSDVAVTSGYPRTGIEARLIERHVRLRGCDVIEIGCGAGRLTFQYAASARSVHAFDPNPDWLARARADARSRGLANVRFAARAVQDWRPPRSACDVVLFSWSLC